MLWGRGRWGSGAGPAPSTRLLQQALTLILQVETKGILTKTGVFEFSGSFSDTHYWRPFSTITPAKSLWETGLFSVVSQLGTLGQCSQNASVSC